MINAYDLYSDLTNNAFGEYTANYAEGIEYIQEIINALPLNLTEAEQLQIVRTYVLLFATAVWLEVRDDDFISGLQSELAVSEAEVVRLSAELARCAESCKDKPKPRPKRCKSK